MTVILQVALPVASVLTTGMDCAFFTGCASSSMIQYRNTIISIPGQGGKIQAEEVSSVPEFWMISIVQ